MVRDAGNLKTALNAPITPKDRIRYMPDKIKDLN